MPKPCTPEYRREAEASLRSGPISSRDSIQHGGSEYFRTRDPCNPDMTDLFTKYAVAVPLMSTDSAKIARELVEKWVLTFGVPNVLRTDQGKKFRGKLILEMCRLLGTDKNQTSPYKPKVNERT